MAPAVVRVASLMPVRAVVLPSAEEVAVVTAGGNTLLTIDMITREALRLVHKNMAFIRDIDRQWDASKKGDRIVVRIPQRYAA